MNIHSWIENVYITEIRIVESDSKTHLNQRNYLKSK